MTNEAQGSPPAEERAVGASIRSPEHLWIRGGRRLSYGAHQTWYPSWISRMSGCGPTAASNLLWYLAATRPRQASALFAGDGTSRPDMKRLMESVWDYVTPGMRGVDKASILTEGALRYGEACGVLLQSRVLEIPAQQDQRPPAERLRAFLQAACWEDLPVAFLNLSNGAVKNLDSWHWVTLVSVDENLQAEMYDQSRRQRIDLALWLNTTKGGGAFVVLLPIESEQGELDMKVTKETNVGDILDFDEGTATFFLDMGMHCLGCPASRSESVAQACAAHGTNADRLVDDLNKYLAMRAVLA